MSAGAFQWTCPVCGRQVPRRVDSCFCGIKRSQADEHATREDGRRRQPQAAAREAAVLLLVGLGIGGLIVREISRDGAPPAVTPAAAAPPSSARPSAPVRTPTTNTSLTTPAAPWPRENGPLPAELPAAQPAPEPPIAASTPAHLPPPDPIEARRAAALEELRRRFATVSQAADRLAERARVYDTECRGGIRLGGGVSNCDEIQAGLAPIADQIARDIDAAEDEARRNRLEPGAVRQLKSQLGLDGARFESLLQSARQLQR